MKQYLKKGAVDLLNLIDKMSQWNWSAIRVVTVRVILVAGVLSVLAALLLAIVPAISGHYVSGISAFGGLPEPDQYRPTIVFTFGAPVVDSESGYYTSTVQRRVYAIFAPKEFSYNLDRFCFTDLREFRQDTFSEYLRSDSKLYGTGSRSRRTVGGTVGWEIDYSPYGTGGFLLEDCIDKKSSSGRQVDYIYNLTDLNLYGNSKFFYPFDNLVYESTVWLDGNVAQKGDEPFLNSIAPRIVGEVFAPNWDVNVNITEGKAEEDFGTTIRIEYKRPLIYRILVPTLLLMVFGIIFALPFVTETSTFVETLIGVIFGLWGLRTVLTPPDVTWSTIIDPAILFLYALLGFFALLRIAIIPAWKKWGK